MGRGQSPNIKTLWQPGEVGAEEEAMLEPISSVGLGVDGGSQITNGTTVKIGRGPELVSVGHLVDSEASHGLLRPWGAGAG